MKVFGEAIMARFARKHAASRKSLQRFLEIARAADWPHFSAVKQSFASAGHVSRQTVIFDVGGNKYRVIAMSQRSHVNEALNGRRSISAEQARKLAKMFSVSPGLLV